MRGVNTKFPSKIPVKPDLIAKNVIKIKIRVLVLLFPSFFKRLFIKF